MICHCFFRTFDFIKRVDKGRFNSVKDRSQRCDKELTLERQLCKSFTVIIRPLSTCLIKANFHVALSHRRSTTVMVLQNSLAPMWIALGTRLIPEMPLSEHFNQIWRTVSYCLLYQGVRSRACTICCSSSSKVTSVWEKTVVFVKNCFSERFRFHK